MSRLRSTDRPAMHESSARNEDWKPPLRAVLVEHLMHVMANSRTSPLPAFMHAPLREWRFGHILWSFIRHRPPSFHTRHVTCAELLDAFFGRTPRVIAGAGSWSYFRAEMAKIRSRGPLALELPPGKPAAFFHATPSIAGVDCQNLPEAEGTIFKPFLKTGLAGSPSPTGFQAPQPVAAYAKRKLEIAERFSGCTLDSVAMGLLALARRLSVERRAPRGSAPGSVAARGCTASDDSGLPLLGNEAILWSASVQAIVISVVLEYLGQHERYRCAPHGSPTDKTLEEFSGEAEWAMATVGDLVWMCVLYERWVVRSERHIPIGGLGIPFLKRNPVFVVTNIKPWLAHYPEDATAQRQMLVFLATCPHAYRKHIIEDIFRVRPDDSPWQNYVRAAEWLAFLGGKAQTWASGFTPPPGTNQSGQDASPANAAGYMKRVVSLWEAQTLRAGIVRESFADLPRDPRTKAAIDMPSEWHDLFSKAHLDEKAKEACGSWPVLSVPSLWAWLDVPAVPVTFDSLVLSSVSLPEGL